MKYTIGPQANIKTDGWQGYSPLKNDFEHLQAYIDEYTYRFKQAFDKHLHFRQLNYTYDKAQTVLCMWVIQKKIA